MARFYKNFDNFVIFVAILLDIFQNMVYNMDVLRIIQEQKLKGETKVTEEREKVITYELIKRGIKPHFQGFRFLVDAIDIYIENYKNPLPVLEVYEMVGKNFNVDSINVERNIRNARLHSKKEFTKMSNVEFISRVAIDFMFNKGE